MITTSIKLHIFKNDFGVHLVTNFKVKKDYESFVIPPTHTHPPTSSMWIWFSWTFGLLVDITFNWANFHFKVIPYCYPGTRKNATSRLMIKWEQEGSPPCRTSSACHMWKLLSWRFYENPTAFLLECRILCQRMWCSVATSSPRTLSSCLLWSPSCLISRSGPILKPFALRGF